MSLRNLSITVELPTTATTGRAAKEEHARILRAILSMLSNPFWSAFDLPLYDSYGNECGHARLANSFTPERRQILLGPPIIQEEPEHGIRLSA